MRIASDIPETGGWIRAEGETFGGLVFKSVFCMRGDGPYHSQLRGPHVAPAERHITELCVNSPSGLPNDSCEPQLVADVSNFRLSARKAARAVRMNTGRSQAHGDA
jgi:hypothetical protein